MAANSPLAAFYNAASRVPAYRTLLEEAGITCQKISSPEDFQRLPILDKGNTFERFAVEELCLDGTLGRPATLLTSSGHSGVFAFGITDTEAREKSVQWIDDSLDRLFGVRSKPSLLINCLPMGVKVTSHACTLAETSVRPDMVLGLVKAFGRHYQQLILVAEAAFLKLVLESGIRTGLNWKDYTVQVILGEEPLAENARRYLGEILGHDLARPEEGIVFSSFGVAELGLNVFFEVPPVASLVMLRRQLHVDPVLRRAILGSAEWVPPFFTYDPNRVFVEFDAHRRLIVTTLEQDIRIPLIRYATGDYGDYVRLPAHVRPDLAQGVSWEIISSIPIITISGKAQQASTAGGEVSPEAVKEGLYHESSLAELVTANFRLVSAPAAVVIRIQLSPTVTATPHLENKFHDAISHYVRAPFIVKCEAYETFRSGMALDYERKFRYSEVET